jgi:hypothetical protein
MRPAGSDGTADKQRQQEGAKRNASSLPQRADGDDHVRQPKDDSVISEGGPSAAHSWRTLIGPRNWSSAERRILGAVDDDWLGRRQLEDAVAAERPGRLVAGVKLVAGA